jgi:uncharacterized protein YgbK (DUF1537 family)
MSFLLGAIGDDMTGSTDLALMLGKNGMTAVQYIGVPRPQDTLPAEATAAVVSLKSRTVMDAVNDRNLIDIGTACSKLKLITGGSAVAMGLPANFRRAGALNADGGLAQLPKLKGAAVVLAGSCSQATRRQINRMMRREFLRKGTGDAPLRGCGRTSSCSPRASLNR